MAPDRSPLGGPAPDRERSRSRSAGRDVDAQPQAAGVEAVLVCADCKEAFGHSKPWLCKYALANDLWLGRRLPLFRNANITHQMLLALARLVTTKVVLRPESKTKQSKTESMNWDFLFHQSGMIGTAILFGNASCKKALKEFPPEHVQDSFAVSFVGKLDQQYYQTGSADAANAVDGLDGDALAAQLAAKCAVKGIARLKVDR